MDPRTRWQKLQAYLADANALLERGAPSQALPLVEAALDLDPEFLAARDLRDSIIRRSAAEFPFEQRDSGTAAVIPMPSRPSAERPAERPASAVAAAVNPNDLWLKPQARLADVIDLRARAGTPVATVAAAAVVPAAPASIEERARQRRLAHCVEVARTAIAQALLPQARQALEEARTLAPLSPDVAHLLEDLEHLEQGGRRRSWRRPATMVAAALLVGVLGWMLDRDAVLQRIAENAVANARPAGAAPLVDPARLAPGAVTTQLPSAPLEQPAAEAEGGAVTVLSTTGRFGAPYTTETIAAPSPADADADAAVRRDSTSASAQPAPVLAAEPAASALSAASASAGAALTSGVTGPQSPRAEDGPFAMPSSPDTQVPTAPASAAVAAPPVVITPAVTTSGAAVAPPVAPGASPTPAFTAPAAAPENNAATAANATAAAIPDRGLDDDRLVREVLQRYRAAYDALDAASAQAVWPSVNTAALARAFGDLSSQQLRFAECGVEVRGSAAQATCRGTARYVPRVGGREPREEARVWSFALRKNGPQWVIHSARVSAP